MSFDRFMGALAIPEVYRVGGSVRDELMGRAPKDADYVVRGVTLEDLDLAFAAAKAETSLLQLRGDGPVIGVRVHLSGASIEVCLPRTEVTTGAGRHDFEIAVDPELSLKEDARRRDFTFNALYRDVRSGEVQDPLGWGREDLRDRIVRTTNTTSFAEDPLRILRALRFVSVLRFELAPIVREEMALHAGAVTGLTRKGVSSTALDELLKILMGRDVARALRLARDTGVLQVFLPELAPMIGYDQDSRYHDKTVDEHTFEALAAAARLEAPLRVRLALLFHDCGKPGSAWLDDLGHKHYYARNGVDELGHEEHGRRLAEAALFRLNAARRLRQDTLTLISRHMVGVSMSTKPLKVRALRAELGDSLLADLLTHKRCDTLGKSTGTSEFLAALDYAELIHREARVRRIPRDVAELPIYGADLLALGLRGKAVGEVQRRLLHEVMAQPKLNERDWLLQRAEKLARARG